MVELNKNFIIFFTLFVVSFSLSKFLLLFWAKLLFMLFMLLMAFLALSSKIKLHMSTFLDHLLTITTYASSALPVIFFNLCTINLSLDPGFVIFLAMMKLKRGIGVTILSLIICMSPEMLSLGNNAPLLSFLTLVPP